jgi:hypothetical protein
MDRIIDSSLYLWVQLGWPLSRLLLFISLGLVIATFLESLDWTRKVAVLAKPLARFGHLSEQVCAAFTVALISGVTANTMLSEAFNKKQISKEELVLANLFNSLPTYFLHLPTVIVITVPLIKEAAFVYVGITFAAALLRTCVIVMLSRFLLPEPGCRVDLPIAETGPMSWQVLLARTWQRFRRRMKKIVLFTVPIYVVIFMMIRLRFFIELETFLAGFLDFIPYLSPQAMGIVALHLAAELTAGLAAAGALLQEGVLTSTEIIVALLIGNILSSPVRAVRHQFPYYAGIFKPRLAIELILYNQSFRVLSLIIAAILFLSFTA